MHDWILNSIKFEWHNAVVTIELRKSGDEFASLRAEGVSNLHIRQVNEWGPSKCVNQLIGPLVIEGNKQELRIQMQSGDVIEIVATHFHIP